MMMTMNVCITIKTVMSTKFISRSHYICLDVYDNSIQNIGNVFVPFAAADVVIICVFCRSEFLISKSIAIDINARSFVSFIFIAVETDFVLYSILLDFDTRHFF
jgi:hypothetical protein